MTDIYTTSRDRWGLRLEHSRYHVLMWAASPRPDVTWWAEMQAFTSPHRTARVPRSLDCLEFA